MAEMIPSKLGMSPEDYKRIGIKKNDIAVWEDGFRTAGEEDTYEWWYFDSFLEDGSSLVLVYNTKPIFNAEGKMTPFVKFNLNTADGRHIEKTVPVAPSEFYSSKEQCDVRIGKNTFKGDLNHYSIHFEEDGIVVDVELDGTVPSWRPETGAFLFGENDEFNFSWLPSIPQGRVAAKISMDGETKEYAGIGYHDHNWGNISMMKLMNHWYWGRAKAGDYTIISSYITAEKQYGYNEFPVFMLAKDGKLLADNSTGTITFREEDKYIDEETGKPVHNKLIYDYVDETQHYVITYLKEKTIFVSRMAPQLPEPMRKIAEKNGFDGAYIRFTGHVILEKMEAEQCVERIEEPALWELMYFGQNME